MLALLRKEFRSYFLSPMGWVIPVVFMFLMGYAFSHFVYSVGPQLANNPDASVTDSILRPLLGSFMRFMFLFIVPFLTMRTFAEERRSGSLELLFTYPVTDGQLVASKIIGSMSAVFVVMLLSLIYPLLLIIMGGAVIEWKVLMAGYLGTLLLGLSFASLGVWASSITDSQVVAVVITFGLILMFWLVGLTESWNLSYETSQIVQHLSLLEHYENFQKGLIQSNDILFYLSFSGFFIFLTLKSLGARKWRG